jgi:hypothetical protein
VKKRLSASRTLMEEFNEFITAIPYFFMYFCEMGSENLHIIPFVNIRIINIKIGAVEGILYSSGRK